MNTQQEALSKFTTVMKKVLGVEDIPNQKGIKHPYQELAKLYRLYCDLLRVGMKSESFADWLANFIESLEADIDTLRACNNFHIPHNVDCFNRKIHGWQIAHATDEFLGLSPRSEVLKAFKRHHNSFDALQYHAPVEAEEKVA